MNSTVEQPITFASFNYPKYLGELPRGAISKRLEEHKAGRSKMFGLGYFQNNPCPNTDGHMFYLNSDFMPRLRWQYCDEVKHAWGNSVVNHRGWFTDEYHSGDKIRGIVMRLPHGRGFLAGWTMGESMASEVEYEIYSDEIDAARAADRLAEFVAERERERQDDEDDNEDNEGEE